MVSKLMAAVLVHASPVAAASGSRDVPAASPRAITSKLHPYAAKFPVPAKTGNENRDRDNKALFVLSQQLVDHILKHPEHVNDLYTTLQQRITSESDTLGAHSDEVVSNLTTINDIPLDVALTWLSKRSSMPSETIVTAKGHHPTVMDEMIAFETQIPKTLRFPDECSVKPVLLRVLDACGDRAGKRLEEFANDGVTASGKVDFNQFSYRAKLLKDGGLWVKHESTGHEKTIRNSGVTSSHRLTDNSLDHHAACVKPPMPPIKLAVLFSRHKEWPLCTTSFDSRWNNFHRHCQDCSGKLGGSKETSICFCRWFVCCHKAQVGDTAA